MDAHKQLMLNTAKATILRTIILYTKNALHRSFLPAGLSNCACIELGHALVPEFVGEDTDNFAREQR